MKNLNFREYQTDDIQFVADGLNAIEKIEKEKITSLNLTEDFSHQLKLWIETISKQPATLIIIAEKENAAVGFVIAMVQPQANHFTNYNHHGVIQAIWVDPKVSHQGIGTQLVSQVLDSFAEFKIAYCDISYHPKNSVAKSFWKKLGFIDAQVTARKFL